MNCAQAEEAILESIDGAEPDASRPGALDAHLSACPGCRAFLERQRRLDRALSAALVPASLPASFKAELLGRTREACDRMRPEEVAAKRAQILADYEASLKAERVAAWKEAKSGLPALLGTGLALTFAVALAAYTWIHASSLRMEVGALLGNTLVATAVVGALSAVVPAGIWALRFALNAPIIEGERGRAAGA